jgi:hypothetical protein
MRWWALLLALLLTPEIARADGGVVRASEMAGPYRVTVFTSPTPLRAGVVDISVLVQDSAGITVPDARVRMHVMPTDQSASEATHEATREAATNKLYQAATVELTPGVWQVRVEVSGEKSSGTIHFDMEVGEPLPAWREMAFWIALPLLPVLLFLLVQWSTRTKTRVP